MPSPPRDTGATWRTTGTLCRERDWSLRRLRQELESGRTLYRTIPEGRVIDWRSPGVKLNVEASEVSFFSLSEATVGIEVLAPTDAPASDALSPSPPSPPSVPPTTPPPETVSSAELRDCLLAIVDDYPDNPLDEDALWREVERRLGRSVGRDRVRKARKKFAPQWVNPVGRPRK